VRACLRCVSLLCLDLAWSVYFLCSSIHPCMYGSVCMEYLFYYMCAFSDVCSYFMLLCLCVMCVCGRDWIGMGRNLHVWKGVLPHTQRSSRFLPVVFQTCRVFADVGLQNNITQQQPSSSVSVRVYNRPSTFTLKITSPPGKQHVPAITTDHSSPSTPSGSLQAHKHSVGHGRTHVCIDTGLCVNACARVTQPHEN
jgi:hypothetical protein